MDIKNVTGDKRDVVSVLVRNDESSTISRGTPVVLQLDGTQDGIAVVLPSTAGQLKTTTCSFGIALQDIAAGRYGKAQQFGFCDYVVLQGNTRAASTDSWSTIASGAAGVPLLVGTVDDDMYSAASIAASAFQPVAALGASVASSAGSATTTANAATVITRTAKAVLRFM
jgi:hypothetical protein